MRKAGLVALIASLIINLLFTGILNGGSSYAEAVYGEEATGLVSLLTDSTGEQWTESELVSLTTDGLIGNKYVGNMDITPDGRYVVFESNGDNMDPRIVPAMFTDQHIYFHDRLTGQTELVDVNDFGELANYYSTNPSISDDGNVIVFETRATNLLGGYSFTNTDPEDSENDNRIYAYNRATETLSLVSVYQDNEGNEQPGYYDSWDANVSGDGQSVVFISRPFFLDGESNSSINQVFVHDLAEGATTMISNPDDGLAENPVINGDGRIIAYISSQFVEDSLYTYNIFVYDANLDEVTMVTEDPTLSDLITHSSLAISGDGNRIVFSSTSSGLVENDNNGVDDIFLIDRSLEQPSITLISKGDGGAQGNGASTLPSISEDGRYIGFISQATNLLQDLNLSGIFNVRLAYHLDTLTNKLTNLGGLEHPIVANEIALSNHGFIFIDSGIGRTYVKAALNEHTRPTWQASKAISYTLDEMLEITWTELQGNEDIAGYRIYEKAPHPLLGAAYAQERLIGFTDAETTSFIINEMPDELTDVTYRIEAVDNLFQTSKNGPVLSFVPDEEAPTWPNEAAITAVNIMPTRVTLNWSVASDNGSIARYELYQNGQLTVETSATSHTISNLQPETSYSFYVIAVDAAGNSSAPLPALSITTLPATTATLSHQTHANGDIVLTWSEGEEIDYYRLLQNETVITDLAQDQLTYTVTNLVPATTYTFKVVGFNADDEQVYESQQLTLTTDPMVITRVSLSNNKIINRTVPIDSTEQITVIGQPGREAKVTATFTTWKDEEGQYTLAVPREVTETIPMTESEASPGTYIGSFTFSEGIAELRRIDARLAYNDQTLTAPLTVGGLPITVLAKLNLTVQSTVNVNGYKLSLLSRADGTGQSKIITEEATESTVLFDRLKANQALLLRVFSPAGNLLEEYSLSSLKAGRVQEYIQEITAVKTFELTFIGVEGGEKNLTVYFDGLNGEDELIQRHVATSDDSGKVSIEWHRNVEKVMLWVPSPPKQYKAMNQEIVLSNTTATKEEIELQLKAKSRLHGTVYDSSGNPISGAIVSLLNYQDGYSALEQFQTETDENGEYEIDAYQGTGEVFFSYDRNVTKGYTIELPPNDSTELNHTFSPLLKHTLKINLYITNTEGVRQGPVAIDQYLASFYGIRVDGQFMYSDTITLIKEPEEKVPVIVNGSASKLSRFEQFVVLDEDGYTEVDVELTPEVLTVSGKLAESAQWRNYWVDWQVTVSRQNAEGEWLTTQKFDTFGSELSINLFAPGTYKLAMESEIGRIERIFQHSGITHVDLGVLTPEPLSTVLKDKSSNHLTASPTKLTAGQLTKARLSYRVDINIDNSAVLLQIPKGLSLLEGSVTWNGEQAQYTVEDNMITVNTGELKQGDSGVLTYQFQLQSDSNQTSMLEAYMRYGAANNPTTERIGSVLLSKATLTVQAPANPTNLNWRLGGLGEAGSKVSLYVSGKLLGHTQVSPGGLWSMEVKVPDPKGPTSFEIYAESQLAGEKYRTPIKIVNYDPDQPRVTTLTIEQTNMKRTTYDLSNGMLTFPSVVNPYYPLIFEIGFDKPEEVENVELHIAGDFDMVTGKAELQDGVYFVEMPIESATPLGQYIYVTFDRKQGVLAAPESEDEVIASLPPNMREFIVEEQEAFTQIDEDTIQGSVELVFPESEDLELTVSMELERNTDYVPTAEELQLAAETGNEVYGLSYNLLYEGEDVILQVVSYIPADSISNLEQGFESGNSSIQSQMLLGAMAFNAASIKSAAGGLLKMTTNVLFNKKSVGGFIGTEMVSFRANHNSLEGALGLRSKANALGKLAEQIGKCNPAMAGYFAPKINNLIEKSIGFEVAKVGISLAGIALAPQTFGASLAIAVASEMIGNAMDAHIERQTNMLRDGINKYSGKCEPNPGDGGLTEIDLGDPIASSVWIYDPSGYVYETFEDNRLEGVKATVTVKETESNKFVIWDAEWFGQINPQVTDLQGRYGWDVPPGIWQVIYEKSGYVTAKSAELQVTPPHFDVNIPMVSYAVPKPKLLKAESDENETIITFETDKYVFVSNVTNDSVRVTLDGEELEGVIEAVGARPYGDDEIQLARGFRFISNDSVAAGEEVSVTLRAGSIISYSGTELDEDYAEVIEVVVKDSHAPTITSASTEPSGDVIILSFSEPLDKSKLLLPSDVVLNGTLRTVSGIDYGKNGQSIRLYLSGKLINSDDLSVTIPEDYVADLSGNGYAGGTVSVNTALYSSNASLSSLKLTGYSLSPVFKSNVVDYKAYIPKDVNSLSITATAANAGAAVSINGRKAESGISLDTTLENEEIIVAVTAEDGLTKQYYNIEIVRGKPPITGGDSLGTDLVIEDGAANDKAELELKSSEAGVLSLDDRIKVEVPADAFDQGIKLLIETVKQAPNATNLQGKQLASSIFEVTKSAPGNFNKPITITLKLNQELKSGQAAGIYYFDEEAKQWIRIGGKVDGRYIRAKVDHFTKFAAFVTEPAAGYKDVIGHWALGQIANAMELGIVNGYTDKTFRPNANISRAEFVVMLSRGLKLEGEANKLDFSDEALIPSWAKEHITLAVQHGLISGYSDNSFGPNKLITRAEMVTMISRALESEREDTASLSFEDNEQIPAWAKEAVKRTVAAGIIKGKLGNRFAPQDNATRAEAVTMIIQLLEALLAAGEK